MNRMNEHPKEQVKSRRNIPLFSPLLLIALLILVAALIYYTWSRTLGIVDPVPSASHLIVPGSKGIGNPVGAIQIGYDLPRDTLVTAMLEGPISATILSTQQAAGSHILRFNGVVTDSRVMDGYTLVQRVVPDGVYTINLSGENYSQRIAPVVIQQADTTPPSLENIVIKPEVVSPNSDAVDDVAEVTFRTDQTTTLSIDLTDGQGQVTPMLAPVEKGPGEQNAVITAQDLIGQPLPNGVYTATIRAEDRAGNRVEAYRPVKVEGAGEASIEILKVEITPQQIIAGQAISVSITVRNNGDVPLRTQGPDAGFTYTTNDTYASIEGNRYTDKAGLWRIGVDWDANGGGGAYRYPFRWGFGKTLMPGETVITGGMIVILKQEREMWFYAGALQEGIRIALDRLGRTRVGVDF